MRNGGALPEWKPEGETDENAGETGIAAESGRAGFSKNLPGNKIGKKFRPPPAKLCSGAGRNCCCLAGRRGEAVIV